MHVHGTARRQRHGVPTGRADVVELQPVVAGHLGADVRVVVPAVDAAAELVMEPTLGRALGLQFHHQEEGGRKEL